MRGKIAFNTIVQLAGKFFTSAVTIAITALITRDLGEAGYGQFTLIMGFPAFFYIISDFGLNAIVARELSGEKHKLEEFFPSLITLRLIISAILVGVGLLSLFFLPYDPVVKIGIVIALFTILTQALHTSTNVLFQVNLLYKRSVAAVIGSYLVLLGLILAIVNYDPEGKLLFIVASYVVSGIVLAVVSFRLARSLGGRFRFSLDKEAVRKLFLAGLPLGLMMVFAQVHGKADIFLMSILPLPESFNLTRDQTLGVYGLSYKVFEVVLVFATFFMNAAYPVMVKRAKKSLAELNKTFFQSVGFLFLTGVVGLVGLYFASPFIIKVLGGASGFEQSILILRLLGVGLPIFFVSAAFQWYMIALHKQKALPVIYLIGAVLTLILNLVFIPQYSYIAAAVVTWIIELLILVLMALYSAKYWLGKFEGELQYGN